MRTAHVRHIEVKGSKYVQAVKYSDKFGEKFRVLQSFGISNYESDLRAELYVAAYDALVEAVKNKSVHLDLKFAALAVFGFILGARMVEEILEAKYVG